MKNEKRDGEQLAIMGQILFVRTLLERLDADFNKSRKEQDDDKFDNYSSIRNHTRFANDVIRLRRELLTLEKMFSKG